MMKKEFQFLLVSLHFQRFNKYELINVKSYYFISGLPRSGSTLLSAILKQNPEFYADIASPFEALTETAINVISCSENNFQLHTNKEKTYCMECLMVSISTLINK